MNLTINPQRVASITKGVGSGTYRKNPDDIDTAILHAAHCSKRDNQRYVVMPGNSYMNRYWAIVDEKKSASHTMAYTPKEGWNVYVVEPNGEVFKAVAK